MKSLKDQNLPQRFGNAKDFKTGRIFSAVFILAFPHERLVWATNGMLFTGELADGKLVKERCLHDFNKMTFEAIAAPY